MQWEREGYIKAVHKLRGGTRSIRNEAEGKRGRKERKMTRPNDQNIKESEWRDQSGVRREEKRRREDKEMES